MTALTEEQLRIRGYLQSQAAKLGLAELVAKVRADQEQVRLAADSVPAARFTERPAAGEWSANEVMAHVVDGAVRVSAAIRSVLDSGALPPPLEDVIRRDVPSHSAGEWWAQLVAAREELWARLATATGDERLDITWPHMFFGPLNWREWLLFLRIHDLDHARQMQAIAGERG